MDSSDLPLILSIMIIFSFIGAMLFLTVQETAGNTYKQGQIDAMNGKMYYKLKTNSDKESEWERVDVYKIKICK